MTLSILPIPSRGQASNPESNVSGSAGSGVIEFPSSVPSCTTCKPAFASAACQQILASISERAQAGGSTTISAAISNETLIGCQCQRTFLDAYSACVDCFFQTDQLDLVFGSTGFEGQNSQQLPSQEGLENYCKLAVTESGLALKEKGSPALTSPATESATTPPSSVSAPALLQFSTFLSLLTPSFLVVITTVLVHAA
ncbi:hypothetical protein BGZ73_006233 [Actinomortierella ambigua]|nr:hypothetical protein BGZ73_006233 [Actinomortierella ambigua]